MTRRRDTVAAVLGDVDKGRILAGCDEEQQAAITSDASPLLVVAGAGAGKTRILTRRIAWRVAQGDAGASHVLALTFTRKAALEVRERLGELGLPERVTAGTFHAIALAQLRERAIDEGGEPPRVLDSKVRLLGKVVPSSSRGASSGAKPPRRELLSAVAGEIEWAKASRIPPEDYENKSRKHGRRTPVAPSSIAQWYAAYEAQKKRAGLVDFDDLLENVARDIADNSGFAAVQRWRFRHLFVDELQDANPAQLRLLDAWLGERDDLFCVGDARQAIYGWNGADPSAVLAFPTRYPGATVLELSTNYRSTPQVVSVASSVLREEQRFQNAASSDGPTPTVTAYESDTEEASGVAAAIRRRYEPALSWRRFAVLARTNAQLEAFEQAFDSAGISHRGSTPVRWDTGPEFVEAIEKLDRSGGAEGFTRWFADLKQPADGSNRLSAHSRARRSALLRIATDFVALESRPTAAGFLRFLDESTRDGSFEVVEDGVDLLTFHRAKGLEWPVVFVTGIEVGLLPIAHAASDAAIEEERRLFYVALSRATSELHCSWARRRSFGGRAQRREPSPFLDAVLDTCADIERQVRSDAASAKAQLARVRSALEAVSPTT
ncbi:MAG: ATP-dependent helicase [Acidimicrobiales bacterium]